MERATIKLDPQASSQGQGQGALDSAPGPAQPPQAKRRLGAGGWSSLSLLLLVLLLLLPMCGKRKLEKGPRTESMWEGKWPWQVSIRYGKRSLCEGTLIDVHWVLTASHCIHRTDDPALYHVLVGSHKLYEESPKSLKVGVKMIFRYPDITKNQPYGQDLALLLLELPVKLSSYVMPVCLPKPGLNFEEEKVSCWMTGWERASDTVLSLKASSLQEVQLPFIKNSECNTLYASMGNLTTDTMYKIEDDMLCAGDISNPKVICLGEVGSPLVCEFSKVWTQVAVGRFKTEAVFLFNQECPREFTGLQNEELEWILDVI
ncbi:serine protease 27-like [Trichosurus vulpecula]|uniref:serine protease 27-like n=1 Tax=Trichosurus vulpecula TaxID=9337 RepID=UPI00186B537F|nr:serine protease 27-like [Trichosurus vulpecula]